MNLLMKLADWPPRVALMRIKNQPDTKRVNLFNEPPELESMKFQRIRGAARTEKSIRSV